LLVGASKLKLTLQAEALPAMLRVALTGGLCSGKSTVAHLFADLGAPTINADAIGHRLLEPGQAGYEAVRRAFGNDVIDASGAIDRARLGNLVFSDEHARRKLNAVLHPLIISEIDQQLADLERHDEPLAIVEAALFVEEGLHRRFNRLIVVTAEPEQKIARFQARTGGTREQAEARMAAQLSDEEKAQLADFVIDNSADVETTRAQVESIYGDLLAARPQQGTA
jgi:dephospho-CoA kinase